MTSTFRDLVNKATYSTVVAKDEGYTEYKGFGVNPDDPRAFSSNKEIDEYYAELLKKEDELLNQIEQ